MEQTVEELRAQRAIYQQEAREIKEKIKNINAEISNLTCPFKVGDIVIDALDNKWKIEKIFLQDGSAKENYVLKDYFIYWGRSIKKDGSPGKLIREMYDKPFRKVE